MLLKWSSIFLCRFLCSLFSYIYYLCCFRFFNFLVLFSICYLWYFFFSCVRRFLFPFSLLNCLRGLMESQNHYASQTGSEIVTVESPGWWVKWHGEMFGWHVIWFTTERFKVANSRNKNCENTTFRSYVPQAEDELTSHRWMDVNYCCHVISMFTKCCTNCT